MTTTAWQEEHHGGACLLSPYFCDSEHHGLCQPCQPGFKRTHKQYVGLISQAQESRASKDHINTSIMFGPSGPRICGFLQAWFVGFSCSFAPLSMKQNRREHCKITARRCPTFFPTCVLPQSHAEGGMILDICTAPERDATPQAGARTEVESICVHHPMNLKSTVSACARVLGSKTHRCWCIFPSSMPTSGGTALKQHCSACTVPLP